MRMNRVLFSSFVFFVLAYTVARPDTIVVGPTGAYATIQAAITNAYDGDTIVVQRNPGVPYETSNVVIDKRLHIMSEPLLGEFVPSECVLDPGLSGGHIFEVLVQGVLLD